MEVKYTKYGKTFTGKFESSKTKFRKDHIELNMNLNFLKRLLNFKKRKSVL